MMSRRALARPLLVSTAPAPGAKKKKKKTTLMKIGKADAAAVTAVDIDISQAGVEQDDAPESESSRLREQLLHVLVDHQRQEEEIVALRALARSLKEEVEFIHKQQQSRYFSHNAKHSAYGDQHEKRPHEFFKLDLQLKQLRSENSQLRDELSDANDALDGMRVFVERELPQFKIAAVQANAELKCVKSQLDDERAHCDRLEAQVAHYKARSSAPMQSPVQAAPSPLRKQVVCEADTKFESQREQAMHTTRDARRREREQFLLQCRFSAVKTSDDKENSECGNREDPNDAVDAPLDAYRGRSSFVPSVVSNSSRSSSSLSSRVHRDLSVLDHELQALQNALT